MTDTTYVGLDLSLSGAGISVLAPGRELLTTTIKSDNSKYGPKVGSRRQRLIDHRNAITTWVTAAIGDAETITLSGIGTEQEPFQMLMNIAFVVEAASFASQNGSQHERAGLWWLVVDWACSVGIVHEVAPTTLKKFATGVGTADKPKMAWVTAREFPQITKPLGDDETDALWLATIGRYHADRDLAGVAPTAYRDASIKAISWS